MTFRTGTLVLLGIAGAFLAGLWIGRNPGERAAPGARRILYYHDPMHPAYRSDKPGVAPDCGMQLEPVYADAAVSASAGKEISRPGTVVLSANTRQQLGVRVAEVGNATGAMPIRVLGRVVADEMRVFRIVAPTDGLVQELKQITTGSLVKQGETLAVFSNVEFLAAERAYLFALISAERYQTSGQETAAQTEQSKVSVQQARLALRKLGMSEPQIEEVARTRQATENIRMTAPASGFVVARNIASGLKFDRGTEFYRIADLSHVWVVADVFENDIKLLPSLTRASVRYQDRSIAARMSDTMPQFDPVSRAMRVRLEVENADFTLRPDMFVNVEFQVKAPSGVSVPVDAVIDSGLHKTVFVERGNGAFEPRAVQTGARFGDRIVVTNGLAPGERVVVSGAFLIDSESRLRVSSENPPGDGHAKAAHQEADPVCGMDVDISAAGTKRLEVRGKTLYFCSDTCLRRFQAEHPGTKGPV